MSWNSNSTSYANMNAIILIICYIYSISFYAIFIHLRLKWSVFVHFFHLNMKYSATFSLLLVTFLVLSFGMFPLLRINVLSSSCINSFNFFKLQHQILCVYYRCLVHKNTFCLYATKNKVLTFKFLFVYFFMLV